jgi:hypothetical protein
MWVVGLWVAAGSGQNDDPNGMAIMWATNGATATSTVRYGVTPAMLNNATGTSETYFPVRAAAWSCLPVARVPTTASFRLWWSLRHPWSTAAETLWPLSRHPPPPLWAAHHAPHRGPD